MNKLMPVLFSILLTVSSCSPISDVASPKTPATRPLPQAYIDSISPENAMIGQEITLRGHGVVEGGSIVAYSWRSNLGGDLNIQAKFETSKLSAGEHTIYFKVQDKNGRWSNEVQKKINIFDTTPINADESPVISFFHAEPATITEGEKITLSWDIANASNVVIEPQIGSVNPSGSIRLSPSKSTSYVLRASNKNSTSTTSTTVTVNTTTLSKITKIALDGPAGSNNCPVTMDFSALITTDGPCTVSYQWEQSNGVISPKQSIVFYLACTQTVTYSWVAPKEGNYWVRLHAFTPNELISQTFSVFITCKSGVITDVKALTSSGSGIYICPVSVNFSSSITMDGPGTVTYLWLLSDGTATPVCTLAFSEAGTQTVTYTWQITKFGKYWAQLHTLKPNIMKTKEYLTLGAVTIDCK